MPEAGWSCRRAVGTGSVRGNPKITVRSCLMFFAYQIPSQQSVSLLRKGFCIFCICFTVWHSLTMFDPEFRSLPSWSSITGSAAVSSASWSWFKSCLYLSDLSETWLIHRQQGLDHLGPPCCVCALHCNESGLTLLLRGSFSFLQSNYSIS